MNIKELRKRTGLTQSEFGKKLGIGLQSIQNYESGKTKPSDTIKILIPYVFDEYLNNSNSIPKAKSDDDLAVKFETVKKENEQLKIQIETLTDFKNTQARTIELLEDRVELYKLKLDQQDSKPNKAG